MALIGLGVGPQLSGLQIAMMRVLEPARIGGGLGTLMLLRQVGAAVALAAAETIYASGLHEGVRRACTGHGGLGAVVLGGAVLAAAALASVPRRSTRFALAPA